MGRIKAIHVLLVLSLLNVIIFIFRDHFVYKPYSDREALYSSCDGACTMKWKQFISDYPVPEFVEARTLSDKIIDTASSTKEKILRIGKFLVHQFRDQEGQPKDEILQASPFQQYKSLSAHDSLELWCGNYTQMFAWFCWTQGITTRTIEFMIPGDRHVVNECYLPETGNWVLVDLTNNLLFAEDSFSTAGIDLLQFRDRASTSGLITWKVSSDSLLKTGLDKHAEFISRYYSKEVPYYYYHRINNERVYTMGNKLASYVLPLSWYEILHTKRESNLLFYVKEIFLFLWMIAFFAFLAGRMKSTS